MIKIGVCAWVLPMKEREVFQFAQEIGFQGVQLDLGKNVGGYLLQDRKVQQEYLESAHAKHLEIPTLALNVLCDVGMIKAQNKAFVQNAFESVVEVAAQMKIKTIQVPSFYESYIQNEDDLYHTMEHFKYASKLCEQNGIKIGTENALSAEDNLRLLKEVNSEALFVYFDTQNPYRFAKRDSVMIAKALEPYILEIHAKDSLPDMETGLLLGEGDTNFRQVMRIFSEQSFEGWIQLESEYKAYKSFAGHLNYKEMIKNDLETVRQIFAGGKTYEQ